MEKVKQIIIHWSREIRLMLMAFIWCLMLLVCDRELISSGNLFLDEKNRIVCYRVTKTELLCYRESNPRGNPKKLINYTSFFGRVAVARYIAGAIAFL